MTGAASAYEPRPDSAAFRALAHMQLLHKGSEIPTGVLAIAIGADPNGLPTMLQAAVDAGIVFRRQKGGHLRSPVFWSLADHSKKETPKGANRDASAKQSLVAGASESAPGRGADGPTALDAAPVFHTRQQDSQHVVKAEAARPDATDRETPAHASPSVGSMGAGQPADAGAAGDSIELPAWLTGRAYRDPDEPHESFARRFIDPPITSNAEAKAEVAAIALITMSITCTPHQAERLAQFLRQMTEVRS